MRSPALTHGFTLIELLITLAILAVLATTVLPVAQITAQRQKEQELRASLREIRNAIDAYKRAYDDGRMVQVVNSTGYPPSLDVLVQGVEDVKNPRHAKMYFLRRIPRDPFAVDAGQDNNATWTKRAYASEADSPSEGADVYDVISKSATVGLNGVAYNKW